MRYFLFFLFSLCFLNPLFAIKIDTSSQNYQEKEKRFRVDIYDFSGSYPQLENIEIDGKRKKRVEMLLTGDYPQLEKIQYEGSFGLLSGKLTGLFPKLSLVEFLCSSAAMHLDLNGKWQKDCTIYIRGSTGNVTLKLPTDVGITVHTKTEATGKVINTCLQKKGWGWLSKTFVNEFTASSPVNLNIYVEVTNGKIFLES